jgi:hypothetical protein
MDGFLDCEHAGVEPGPDGYGRQYGLGQMIWGQRWHTFHEKEVLLGSDT